MKITLRSFWQKDSTYFPLIHISIQKDFCKYRLDFGLLGFCLIIDI